MWIRDFQMIEPLPDIFNSIYMPTANPFGSRNLIQTNRCHIGRNSPESHIFFSRRRLYRSSLRQELWRDSGPDAERGSGHAQFSVHHAQFSVHLSENE